MPDVVDIQKAFLAGRKQADTVVTRRNQILVRRTAAIEKAIRPKHRVIPPGAEGFVAFKAAGPDLGPQGHSTLIAEGDSWFDYPGDDILRILEDHHGYEVESVAHKGDRVEDMAYTTGQIDTLTRLVEKVLRQGRKPRAVLLSGGGNDIAGEEFGMLLNHANSGDSFRGLNESIVTGVIDQRIKIAYAEIIGRVSQVCTLRVGSKVPILVHGYDYPVPDGRGFMGGWWFLPGPWLEPGFREKGFEDLMERISITKKLIDRFNEMLKSLVATSGLEHVHYVDLRNTLVTSHIKDQYGPDWANELHPTPSGFEKVTLKFANILAGLPLP